MGGAGGRWEIGGMNQPRTSQHQYMRPVVRPVPRPAQGLHGSGSW
ncbi:MAG: hypothetical protein QOD55_2776 [Solirubrobacteraceae bacterium]|jgi:hypothetical protein|nr:hypothetical protein [Solirubrobacteraceae bacterium]